VQDASATSTNENVRFTASSVSPATSAHEDVGRLAVRHRQCRARVVATEGEFGAREGWIEKDERAAVAGPLADRAFPFTGIERRAAVARAQHERSQVWVGVGPRALRDARGIGDTLD